MQWFDQSCQSRRNRRFSMTSTKLLPEKPSQLSDTCTSAKYLAELAHCPFRSSSRKWLTENGITLQDSWNESYNWEEYPYQNRLSGRIRLSFLIRTRRGGETI